MSKDYKGTDRRHGARRNGSSLLAGILIGLILGLALALGIAWYINKMPSPFSSSRLNPPAKSDTKSAPSPAPRVEDKAAADAKPRFDFYKILPGAEEPAADKQRKAAAGSTEATREAFYLQAGAFQNAPDADNLKARLALLGVEASIETSAVPDKGILHRVRIGPYTRVEDVNRARDSLKQSGVDTTLIKVREPER